MAADTSKDYNIERIFIYQLSTYFTDNDKIVIEEMLRLSINVNSL